MATTLNDRFELIESLPVSPGDLSRAVYKARETVASATEDEAPAGRVVVLRLLPSEADSPTLTQASELAAKLKSHPNILAHYGLTEIAAPTDIEPGLYAVSEFARGLTLRERIRRVAPFSLAVTLDIAVSVAKALVYAHDRGVSHGDLRPEHVLLTPEGQVRVSDFAVARAAREAMGDTANAYADDIRAVGLLVYEMLTGVAPDQMGVAGEQSPREINQSIPPAVDGIVRKATLLSDGRGYTSPAALLADLQQAREDLRTGKPMTWSPVAAKSPALKPASAPAAPGALTQAAEEIAVEDSGRRKRKANAEITEDIVDDYPAGRDGSPVFRRIMMALFVLLVLIVLAASAYFATLLSVPNDVTVPDLVGKQFADAQKEAAREHLSLVKAGEDYSDSLPAGAIYQMSPPPGHTIKAGKEVSVYVSDGPRLTDVPNITGMTLDRAKQALASYGLPLGTVESDFNDASKGLVISQQPTADSKVSHETVINVTVSKGSPPPAAPDGLTASATIQGEIDLSWNDTPEASTYNVYKDGKKIATGLPQSAYSDVNLGDGETHSYTVSAVNANGESKPSAAASGTTISQSDTGDNTTPPPDVTAPPSTAPNTGNSSLKQRDFHIRFHVPSGGGRHNVQIEVQDATGTNIFYDEDRDAGDIVDNNVTAFGNKVIFRIFIDGKLVKQQVK